MGNWSITIAYFATNVASSMAHSIVIENYQANIRDQHQHEVAMLNEEMRGDARDRALAMSDPASVDDIVNSRAMCRVRRIELELKMMKNIKVDLQRFDFAPAKLLSLRRVLLQQWG